MEIQSSFSAGNRNQQAGSLRSPEPRLYPDCKQLTLQTAAATAPQFSALTSAFDDFGGQQYDKVWRTSVLRVIVSFLFRITIRWINARGIWYLVAGQ